MINYEELNNEIKNGKFHNCYIFCGMDEKLIKDSVKAIIKKALNQDFIDLNYAKMDGNNVEFHTIMNACETMPFMDNKRIVQVFRANFLSDSKIKNSSSETDEVIFNKLNKYLDNLPEYSILIFYYVYQNDREKLSKKVKKLQNKCCIVEFNKLKGMNLERKIKLIFDEQGKDIGKAELNLFSSMVDNNLEVVYGEVDKLCAYTLNRDIRREDILATLPRKSDNDIFDLVDFISQKKAEKALEILNELLFRGEKCTSIIAMIERQFKLLLLLKLGLDNGKNKDILAKELFLHPYICEKMIGQSRKFQVKGIEKAIKYCLETEKMLKSSSTDDKTEMELLIINTLTA